MKTIVRFHYLTQDLPDISHRQLIEIACENGVRWIQLRVKNKPFDQWLKIAIEAKTICEKYSSVLIINDNVEIAKQIDADGVHLGKGDMHPEEARKILGDEKIIGGSSNSFDDVKWYSENGADYSGIGPYRFTRTRENLNPVLRPEKIKYIADQCIRDNISLPLIGIGGITLHDADDLLSTGIYGIAVSSAINLSAEKNFIIKAFLKNITSHDHAESTLTTTI